MKKRAAVILFSSVSALIICASVIGAYKSGLKQGCKRTLWTSIIMRYGPLPNRELYESVDKNVDRECRLVLGGNR